MVVFFLRFLRECFASQPKRIALRLNVYTGNGLSLRQIEDYWLDGLGLPRSCLRKHTLNHFPTSSSGKKRNKLPYGVATLTLYSTRVAQHIYGAIQEYAGFEEPAGSTDLRASRLRMARWPAIRRGRRQPSSSSSSAFCACRRFSAWSQTAERSP